MESWYVPSASVVRGSKVACGAQPALSTISPNEVILMTVISPHHNPIWSNPINTSREAFEAVRNKWFYKCAPVLYKEPCRAIVLYKPATNLPNPTKRSNPVGATLWNLTSVKALPAPKQASAPRTVEAQAAPTSPAPYMPARGADLEDRVYLTQYQWAYRKAV